MASRKDIVRVGIISDTHGRLPENIRTIFKDVKLIIHAGDIGGRKILSDLDDIAPVYAVAGNMDSDSSSADVPAFRTVRVAGVDIYVIHDIGKMRIDPAGQGIRVVVHGHTHRRESEVQDGILYLNPGAVSQPRRENASVAVLNIRGDILEPEFFDL